MWIHKGECVYALIYEFTFMCLVFVGKLDQDSVSLSEETHAVAFVNGDNK